MCNNRILLYALFVVGVLFVTPSCSYKRAESGSDLSGNDTALVADSDSSEGGWKVTIHNVDIPRTHLGVTLGMSWEKAKEILAKNGWGESDVADEEEVDSVHNRIFVQIRWINNDNVVPEFKGKFNAVSFEIFDGKVMAINIIPKATSSEEANAIMDEIKKKYPFDIYEYEDTTYYLTSSGALPSVNTHRWYDCSNGQTRLHLEEGSSYLRYRDVRLYDVEAKAYWDKAEAEEKKKKEQGARDKASNY